MQFHKEIFKKNAPITGHEWGETIRYNFEIDHTNPRPYFSLTVDVFRGKVTSDRNLICCGQVTEAHKYLASWVSNRAARWHLWDMGGSIHYTANALYWLGWLGWWEGTSIYKPGDLDVFKSHTNWGLIPEDHEINLNRWLAQNDPIVQNHADLFAHDLRTKHFKFLPEYLAERKAEITTTLETRLTALRQLFIEDMLYVFSTKGGFPQEEVLAVLQES